MNDDPTSLNRLHDLALPAEVPWWPPAAGWFVLLAFLMLAGVRLLVRTWGRWKADAYRREALAQLTEAKDPTSVAEILRRVALVIAPRATIAQLSGEAWVTWLAERCPVPVPANVRERLLVGVYERGDPGGDASRTLEDMKVYAASWIKAHEVAPDEAKS